MEQQLYEEVDAQYQENFMDDWLGLITLSDEENEIFKVEKTIFVTMLLFYLSFFLVESFLI